MPQLKRAMAVSVISAFICTFCSQATKAIEVSFPDANLEAAIRSKLEIPTGPITDADMATLESLTVHHSNLSNLQGIQYATNLEILNLWMNNITDISPLAGLTKLIKLDLFSNNISDTSPIAGLTNLTNLDLSENPISNLTPLAGLTNLTLLDMRENLIRDISPLAGLTNLKHLNLGENNINDISPVANFTNLIGIALSGSDLTDLSPLAELTDLCTLNVQCTKVSDLSPVANLTKLNIVYLSGNNISDVSPLSNVPNLPTLYLSRNQIQTLNLRGMDFSGLPPNLLPPPTFDFRENPMQKAILAEAKFTQQVFDAIMCDRVSIRDGLAELAGLLSLDLSGVDFSELTDLATMYTMDDLEELFLTEATNLDGSAVVTLTTELNSLDWLDVTGLWDSFDTSEQSSLRAWDAIVGNTLITQAVSGDTNGDGQVNQTDVSILADNWQYGVDDGQFATRAMGDFNGDGQIDGSDVTILAGNWQYGANSTATAVPEPATLIMLLALIGLAIVIRKRK